ncbi:hypothetical protein CSKR_100117 [Clonorchis sinensis]|uniref:Uncharacterized protein n=1 Tax=Clonorchis sinensis TaxID=79923 RepID=A0A419QC78_CLOSI|nr:hypothetical protein CSKR_100117 [Clonorchis sinensis]
MTISRLKPFKAHSHKIGFSSQLSSNFNEIGFGHRTRRKFGNVTLDLIKGLDNLAVSQPSCFLRVAWQLDAERVLRLNDYYYLDLVCRTTGTTYTFAQTITLSKKLKRAEGAENPEAIDLTVAKLLLKNRPAVAPFRCLAATPPEGSAKAGMLSGCPPNKGSRDAKVGFEPRTSRAINSRSTHLDSLVSPARLYGRIPPEQPCNDKDSGCSGGIRPYKRAGETRESKWVEREFIAREVRGSNPTFASRLPLLGGQPDSIPAFALPSGGVAARHRKGATAGRFFKSSLATVTADAHDHQMLTYNRETGATRAGSRFWLLNRAKLRAYWLEDHKTDDLTHTPPTSENKASGKETQSVNQDKVQDNVNKRFRDAPALLAVIPRLLVFRIHVLSSLTFRCLSEATLYIG